MAYTFLAANTSGTLQTLDANELTCTKTQAPMTRSVTAAANFLALDDIPTMRCFREKHITSNGQLPDSPLCT